MPKRTDIRSILVIGSGPIVIGQGCEFDYSGTQACKALKEEGYRVILINSNPATIMTDPEFADRTYIEPITPEIVEKIIEEEKPDALLPTLGGQTALNVAMALYKKGIFEKYHVQMIGANAAAIEKGEDRLLFKEAMLKIGLDVARSEVAHNREEALAAAESIGSFPLIIRPAFTLGGSGGGIAYNREEFEKIAQDGIALSPVSEILIEESLLGWKEYEMEVMRDRADNCVVICSIENFDPMGVHTGDSITVAPSQTLTDKEYQRMRSASFAVIREIGVETGGSNIQFAIQPTTGRMIVIEMNPRVSRSSALASKATGFPIAKIAAKLAVGYTLNELKNDITRKTPASFEPTIDYVVTKLPRFTFEKFPTADPTLTTQMKSVGEAMGIGRTFKESLQKALRSLDIKGREGTFAFGKPQEPLFSKSEICTRLRVPSSQRLWWITYAIGSGIGIDEIHSLTGIDPWFLEHLRQIVDLSIEFEKVDWLSQPEAAKVVQRAKEYGFSDEQLGVSIVKRDPTDTMQNAVQKIQAFRQKHLIFPAYRLVDTCAAEFESYTPYYYSTYDRIENEARPTKKPKIIILGGGPNRIGQGIEFDYCCVHASFALRELGYETIMVNSNPETVSTDYDTSDKLYFEPLTVEDVLHIYRQENQEGMVRGVIVQLGGQTPLNLVAALQKAGVPILGTSVESIQIAEDRKLFSRLISNLGLRQPLHITATTPEEALEGAEKVGYPVLVRPSFVLGGRNMRVIYYRSELKEYLESPSLEMSSDKPLLIDQFLEDAIEVDVDSISDTKQVVIGAVMQHIEQAGVHSGDSACVIPTYSLTKKIVDEIRSATIAMTRELRVCGLLNAQFAVKENQVYVLEVNPRASRTIPFVSKAIGKPLAKIAAKVMVGESLEKLGLTQEIVPKHFSVKSVVFPFGRFKGVDILLGPEMKSTGEVMGIDQDLGLAYAKAQMATSLPLPTSGKVFISVRDADKPEAIRLARELAQLGFEIVSTSGTAEALQKASIPVIPLLKLAEGRPNVLDLIKNNDLALVINTPAGSVARADEIRIRTSALYQKIPVITVLAAARAAIDGIRSLKEKGMRIKALQDYNTK